MQDDEKMKISWSMMAQKRIWRFLPYPTCFWNCSSVSLAKSAVPFQKPRSSWPLSHRSFTPLLRNLVKSVIWMRMLQECCKNVCVCVCHTWVPQEYQMLSDTLEFGVVFAIPKGCALCSHWQEHWWGRATHDWTPKRIGMRIRKVFVMIDTT